MALEKKNLLKGPFNSVVISNRKIGECFFKIRLAFEGDGAEAFSKTRAGQFAEIDLSMTSIPNIKNVPEHLRFNYRRNIILRRPFSFTGVFEEDGRMIVEILYCVVGPSSLRMMNLREGEQISVMGPLGNGFEIKKDKLIALLAVGGMGAGPLIHLSKQIRDYKPDMEILGFVGAKSFSELPYEDLSEGIQACKGDWVKEFADNQVDTMVATDDGSAGFKGFITDTLENHIEKGEFDSSDVIIYTCGPEMMLAKVSQISKRFGIECQVSLERRMACGIGLCQGCAVECKKGGSDETFYKMCCKDGPVFDSKEVVFK